jgi:hypothetical protein
MSLSLPPDVCRAIAQLAQIFSRSLSETAVVFTQLSESASVGGPVGRPVEEPGTYGEFLSRVVPAEAAPAPTPVEAVPTATTPAEAELDAEEALAAWKSTAAIYADPNLAAELRRPLPGTDDVVPVPTQAQAADNVNEPREDLIKYEDMARELDASTSFLHSLVRRNLVKKHRLAGKSRPVLSRTEVLSAIKKIDWKPPVSKLPPDQLTPRQAANRLGITMGKFYRLAEIGAIKGVSKAKTGRLVIPIKAIDAFAVPVTTFGRKKKVPDDELTAEVKRIASEVEQIEPTFKALSTQARTAALTVRAGRVRELVSRADEVPEPARRNLHKLGWEALDRIRTIADRFGIWINALISEWSIEDWGLYIRANDAEFDQNTLAKEELEVLEEGNLRALILRHHQVTVLHAREVVTRAQKVLGGDTNEVVKRAWRVLGPKILSRPVVIPQEARRPEPESLPEPDPDSEVAAEVLARTKGKRMLIVGGQGAREEHRLKILKQFRLDACEWVSHERNSVGQVLRIEQRVHPRNFDLMLYLNHFTGHSTNKLVATAKKNGLPVVRIPEGYGIAQLNAEIGKQYTPQPLRRQA